MPEISPEHGPNTATDFVSQIQAAIENGESSLSCMDGFKTIPYKPLSQDKPLGKGQFQQWPVALVAQSEEITNMDVRLVDQCVFTLTAKFARGKQFLVDSKTVEGNTRKIPGCFRTRWDALKSILPSRWQKGWLKPKFDLIDVQLGDVSTYNVYFNVAPINTDLALLKLNDCNWLEHVPKTRRFVNPLRGDCEIDSFASFQLVDQYNSAQVRKLVHRLLLWGMENGMQDSLYTLIKGEDNIFKELDVFAAIHRFDSIVK